MLDSIPTYKLNFNDLKANLDESDFRENSQWCEMVSENEGSFEDQGVLVFDLNGIEAYVNFKLYVDGDISYDPGDYWTPPSADVDAYLNDIEIEEFYLNDIEVELTNEMTTQLINQVEKVVN